MCDAKEKVQPIFEQFLQQLKAVTKMATDVLTGVNQDDAQMKVKMILIKLPPERGLKMLERYGTIAPML